MGLKPVYIAVYRPIGRGWCLDWVGVEGFWPIFFLLVVLKIPVLGSLWLIWWASKQTPEADEAGEEASGGPERRRPPSPRPRGPQHGPRGGAVRRGWGAPPGQRRPVFRPPTRRVQPAQRAKNPATGRGTPSPPPHTRATPAVRSFELAQVGSRKSTWIVWRSDLT